MRTRQTRRIHPCNLGAPSIKLRGVWVRTLRTDRVGYISYVEMRRDEEPLLWIILPPDTRYKEAGGKQWSATSATVKEVKRLNWEPEELPEPDFGG